MHKSEQNKHKYNFLFLTILTILLFISGIFIAYYSYHMLFYYKLFSFSSEDYTDSRVFEDKYLQYNERTALYLRHMENGYTISGRKPKYIDFATSISQTNFDYYYNKLFNENNTFFFYILNELNDDYYYNTSMTDQIIEYLNRYNVPVEYEANTGRISKNTLDMFTRIMPDIYSVIEIDTVTTNNAFTVITENNNEQNFKDQSFKYDYNEDDREFVSSGNNNENKNVENSNELNSGELDIMSDKNAYAESYVDPSFVESSMQNAYSYTNVVSNSPFIHHTNNKSNYFITSYFSNNLPGYKCAYNIYTCYFDLKSDIIGEFGQIKTIYDMSSSVCNKGIVFLPICIVIFISTAVLICIKCGYRRNCETVSINSYDKIPIEISFLSLLIPAAIVAFIWSTFNPYTKQDFLVTNNIVKLILLPYTIMFIFAYPLFLSIVKNLKAKTFIDHTIILRFIRFLFRHIVTNNLHRLSKLYTNTKEAFAYKDIKHIIIIKMLSVTAAYAFIIYLCVEANTDLFFSFIVCCILMVTYFIFFCDTIYHAQDIMNLRELTSTLASGNFNVDPDLESTTATFKSISDNISSLSNVLSNAVENQSRSERMKAELITNVSHDIKTPLTSIINYSDLLQRSDLNEADKTEYLRIIHDKSLKLKSLIDDLMEVSKASSKTIKLCPEQLNLTELIRQSLGEFEDSFAENNLEILTQLPDSPVYIYADGRSTFRIIENLLINAYKYSIQGSRVYIDLSKSDTCAKVTIKNVSQKKISINSDDLMERFVRGDTSRNTEGNGLGLSIAKSLAEVQNGEFNIEIDGDLFKASFSLPIILSPIITVSQEDTQNSEINSEKTEQ